MTTTAARTTSEQSAHFYSRDCEPLYEVPKKDGSGMRPFTLADARKMDPRPVPSVTTVLKSLAKPQLESWKIEQACLAVMTTPQGQAEELDAFVHRVLLHEERQQDQERDAAAKRGVAIHDEIDSYFRATLEDVSKWVEPVLAYLVGFGSSRETETIIVSEDGYGGRLDLWQVPLWNNKLVQSDMHIWDFKTTKNIPKEAYPEHILQCSAYANALQQSLGPARVPITTGNIYISTVNQGEFKVCLHGDWQDTYKRGFYPLLKYWQWSTNWGEA